ncbi:MAG: ATP-binding protein [Sandaracinaceae bacterium]|nr:ATP-binding protein [Sandaracinaceae bacterium]
MTPLHAFIGPNDSGKSTLLRALREGAAALTAVQPKHDIVVATRGAAYGRSRGELVIARERPRAGAPVVVRWVPRSLREASDNAADVGGFLASGYGLPGTLARIFNANDEALATTNRRLSETFPTIAKLRVEPRGSAQWQISVTLASGVRVAVEELSDGVLYWLAFESLRYLEDEWLLLLEEPENGLHPSRIAEVMSTIKHVVAESKGRIQVVMATHSPLVINELEPDQVTLVTRDVERGTQVTPMRQTKNFEERSKVYALGELWLSYANGRDEAELVPSMATGS